MKTHRARMILLPLVAVLFVGIVTSGAAGVFHREHRAPKPLTPPIKVAPGPSLVVVDDSPTAWGVIEATSHEGWYGVETRSVIEGALNTPYYKEARHVVAHGPKGMHPATPVFIRHDAGKWRILFAARSAVVGRMAGADETPFVDDLFPEPPVRRLERVTPPPVDEKANPPVREEIPTPPSERGT